MSGRPCLSLNAIFSYYGLPVFGVGRQIRAWQNRHQGVPFPEPAVRTPNDRFDLYDFDEMTAWLERCCLDLVFVKNRLATRFIRGEFDRPELQRQYLKKRSRSRSRRRPDRRAA